jgi:hypothetical protein
VWIGDWWAFGEARYGERNSIVEAVIHLERDCLRGPREDIDHLKKVLTDLWQVG